LSLILSFNTVAEKFQNIANRKLQRIYYCFLFWLFCFVSVAQQSRIDSLKSVLKQNPADTIRITCLIFLGQEYLYSTPDTAILYYKEAVLKSKSLPPPLNEKYAAAAIGQLGTCHYLIGDYAEALDCYSKAVRIDEKTGNRSGLAKHLGSLGIVYKEQGNYPKALEHYLKALKISEELDNKYLVATWLANIGIVYHEQHDYPRALSYYDRSSRMAELLKNRQLQANNISNSGTVYTEQGDNKKALECGLKALRINEELGNKIEIAKCLDRIGIVYKDINDYGKAEECFLRAQALAEELGDKGHIAILWGNMGGLYIIQKKYPKAETYFLKSLSLAEEIGSMDDIRQGHQNLSDLYMATDRYKEAMLHYRKAMAIKDTLFNEVKNKELISQELNYEFAKKEALANAEVAKKEALAEEERQKQRIITYSVSAGLFLVILLALFIFRSYRQKQKANVIITGQKEEVEKQKQIIEAKNKDITDSITYARRILQARLPKKEEIYQSLPESFVLFKPKDIVSGDFYYFSKDERGVFLAVADCTGHGVPGAFMSIIGSEKLEESISKGNNNSEILRLLNKGIKASLHQSESDESTRDGMDIALCNINLEKGSLKYSAANRPFWIIRKDSTQVEEIRATKKAIGGFTDDDQHFDTHEVKLLPGDTFYIFSDGYADTFSGSKNKKLTSKKFREILLSIQNRSMREQEAFLEKFIEDWKAGTEQVDDILIIGVRI
jgi:serine phosphatase RsbU (regulator of sigma subunit)/Flp pilus assembly protein TadD